MIRKAQSRASNQIFDGARNKDFAGGGQRCDAGADVDNDPANLLAHYLAFSGMEASSDPDSERPDAVGYGAGATDCARGAIEGSKKAVTGCIYLAAAKAGEFATHQTMVTVEQIVPATIAKACSLFGSADDVSEQYGG